MTSVNDSGPTKQLLAVSTPRLILFLSVAIISVINLGYQQRLVVFTPKEGRDSYATVSVKPFDSEKDLIFANKKGGIPHYSSHRCVQSDIPGAPQFVGRTCRFLNLYFSPKEKRFVYFASEIEMRANPNLTEEIAVTNSYIMNKRKMKKDQEFYEHFAFRPEVRQYLTGNIVEAETELLPPVFLLYKPSYNFNLGHFIFDDVLSIFVMLEYFGYENDHQHIPLFVEEKPDPYYRCNPRLRWEPCVKSMKRFMPPLLGVEAPMLRTKTWLANDSSIDYVRLPTAVAGQGILAGAGCREECALFRTPILRRFRKWLFRNVFGDKEMVSQNPPQFGKIVISLPVGNTHEGIEWFKSYIPRLEEKYGTDNVTAVDMASLSMQDQVRLLASTHVLLTNMGGGSATSLFLPPASTMLIFERQKMTEARYDVDMYNSVSYFNVRWLAEGDPVQTVMDHVEWALEQPVDGET